MEVQVPRDVTLEGFWENRCTRGAFQGLGDLSFPACEYLGLHLVPRVGLLVGSPGRETLHRTSLRDIFVVPDSRVQQEYSMQQTKVFLLMAAMTAFVAFVGGMLGGQGGAVIAFGFAIVMNVGMYWFSDRAVLKMYKARVIGPDDAPQLYDMVDRLRQKAQLPMPTVAIAPSPQPNAFATGRNPEHAVVCFHPGHSPGPVSR